MAAPRSEMSTSPSLTVNPAERGPGTLQGRYLPDLTRARLCQTATESVNTIFANCRFEFQKRGQLFIGAHNETLFVAMRVGDPDRSSIAIDG